VTYEGLAPPTELFADLELVGWSPPAPAPPPHDAIDWSRPNEATGERFTLRDYTVTGAAVQPPSGTGSRGTWTDTERAGHVAALGRVLDRHPEVEVDDPGAVVRAPAPAMPPPDAGPAAPATAARPAVGPFVPSAGAVAVLVTAPIKPSLAPRAEDALVALGVTVVFDSKERVRTERYRGSTYETTVTELHLATVTSPEQLDHVVAALADLGLPLTFAEVDAESLSPDGAAGAERPAEPATIGRPAHQVGLACVVALADPRSEDAVRSVFRTLGLVDTSLSAATRIEVSRYRGSRSERAVPAMRVEAWVPEPHARLVANHLAEAARLRVDDTSRLWIVPPEPVVAAVDAAPVEVAPPAAPATARASVPAGPSSVVPSSAPPVPAPVDPRALVPRPTPAFVDHAG